MFRVRRDGHRIFVSEVSTTDGERRTSAEVECLMCVLEPAVYATLCSLLPDGARAAEVGSFKGGSACIVGASMRSLGKSVVLACHDLFRPFEAQGRTHDIEAAFDASVAAWGLDGVIKVKGDSRSTHAVHADGSLDYVFVDGEHGYEGALADLRNFWPKLRPDGWLVVQDSVGPVQDAIETWAREVGCEVYASVVPPPIGHHVTVMHRDPARVAEFQRVHDTVVVRKSPDDHGDGGDDHGDGDDGGDDDDVLTRLD